MFVDGSVPPFGHDCYLRMSSILIWIISIWTLSSTATNHNGAATITKLFPAASAASNGHLIDQVERISLVGMMHHSQLSPSMGHLAANGPAGHHHSHHQQQTYHHHPVVSAHHVASNRHHHQQQQHFHHNSHHQDDSTCEINTDPVIELLLDKMRLHLPEEKITVQNGAITIFDARIVRFAELLRLRASCARRLDPDGILIELPFEAEIRAANVAAKLKYNFYVTDLYGDYSANFSHIRLNGTLEANLEEEWMQVSQFNITSSQVIDDSIVFGYVPRWILEWVRSYFDNDNTKMYEQLAKVMLQKEADNFDHYDLIRHISQSSMLMEPRDEDDRLQPPLNRL